MSERKKRLWQAFVCTGLVIAVWFFYFLIMHRLHQQIELYVDNYSWVYQIDAVEAEGRRDF